MLKRADGISVTVIQNALKKLCAHSLREATAMNGATIGWAVAIMIVLWIAFYSGKVLYNLLRFYDKKISLNLTWENALV
jgi:hypothetical protein